MCDVKHYDNAILANIYDGIRGMRILTSKKKKHKKTPQNNIIHIYSALRMLYPYYGFTQILSTWTPLLLFLRGI